MRLVKWQIFNIDKIHSAILASSSDGINTKSGEIDWNIENTWGGIRECLAAP